MNQNDGMGWNSMAEVTWWDYSWSDHICCPCYPCKNLGTHFKMPLLPGKKEHHSSLSSLSLGPPRMWSTFEAKFNVWSPKWKEKESMSAQTVLQMSLYLVYKNYFRDFPWNSPNTWWESTSLMIFLPWYVLCMICRNLPKTLPAEGSSHTMHVGAHVDTLFPAACCL